MLASCSRNSYLLKCGHVVSNWKERWFELRSAQGHATLSYFASQPQEGATSGTKAKGAVPMEGSVVALTQPPLGVVAAWYTFELVTAKGVS
jgi:hypothetical protein